MATVKPKVISEFYEDSVNSEVDKIPDELSADDLGSNNLSTEALNNITFDDKHYEDDYQRMLVPTGDWVKEDRWETFKESINTNDSMPGDKVADGRLMYSVYGKPEARTVGTIDHQPTLFLRISPDKRYSKNKPTEFDIAYKMFESIKNDVYLSLHGEKMTTRAQLKYFLEEDTYVLRTMKGDNGPIVVDVKVKRTR